MTEYTAAVRTFKTAAKYTRDGTVDMDAMGALKLLLMSSSYSFNSAHSSWSQISANEIASANGYARGGSALSSVTFSSIGTSGFAIKANDRVWTATGNLSARFGIIRHQSSLKLLYCIDFGQNVVTATGEPLRIKLSQGFVNSVRS